MSRDEAAAVPRRLKKHGPAALDQGHLNAVVDTVFFVHFGVLSEKKRMGEHLSTRI